jgi:23S rRNA (cytidine1920-2'-O)/16S rRNA (cytidine1409-2'-O)-methyltransferase
MAKQRLDALLVSRGLVENRSKAQALIMAGEVSLNGVKLTKAGTMVPPDAEIQLTQKQRYVSRGGLKLEYALMQFKIDAKGKTCLDVGASTGGFTDCLLQHGAEKVYALDVGHGQLDYSIRQDKKVLVMEKVNAHYPFQLPGKVMLATMDVSFISVAAVIPNILPHLSLPADMVILYKPQFEADREDVGKGGVIKDPAVHAKTISKLLMWLNKHGWQLLNLTASPIFGADGNREFLIHLRPREL